MPQDQRYLNLVQLRVSLGLFLDDLIEPGCQQDVPLVPQSPLGCKVRNCTMLDRVYQPLSEVRGVVLETASHLGDQEFFSKFPPAAVIPRSSCPRLCGIRYHHLMLE